MTDRKTFLSEKNIPQKWYNIAPDLKTPLAPPLHPARTSPWARRPGADLPDGADHAGDVQDPFVEIPNEVLEVLQDLAPDAAGPRVKPGKSDKNQSQNLL